MIIKKVCVIGAGTMGNGIAHVFALGGYYVNLCDISEEKLHQAISTIEKNLLRMLEKGTISREKMEESLKRIETYSDLKNAVKSTELVVEAATEDIKVKLDIFKHLDQLCDPNTLLATNTSSISITKLASATLRPGKVIGMHFMNPVPIMRLVEVIQGFSTDREVTLTLLEVTQSLDKIPIVVNDYPGFIANRILMPMINEAIYSLYEGVAGVEEIDTIMKLGMAHPMGPLQLADFIGLDVCHSILHIMYEGFGNPKYSPCPLLSNMVLAGKLGVKTREGFYKYMEGSKEKNVSDAFIKK
ncbi:MAG TPA: 3-hydroxyacyl-CoA dehydrogenase NAD-binding domain-containing protein [Saprospiraceae bacterium]|nr:3-hydroxyacyl-CoA dehydrogenase NAD-binding domain-containing protein [Saprospiraceae bacterium]